MVRTEQPTSFRRNIRQVFVWCHRPPAFRTSNTMRTCRNGMVQQLRT